MLVSIDTTGGMHRLTQEPRMRVTPPSSVRVSPGTPSTVRQMNLALVAGMVLAEPGGTSRAQLATDTGLTGATVSRLVRELVALGIVEEEAAESRGGMGRPSTPVLPAARTIVGVGLEINVDYVAGCAVDLTGTVIHEFVTEIANQNSSPEDVLPLLHAESAQMISELRSSGIQEICGVCLAIPGVVDLDEGRVAYASNLGWRDVVPGEVLGELLGQPTLFSIDNDANLQTIAATTSITPRDNEPASFLYVFSEIGIGGAILRDGHLERGANGWAGEIGHATVDPNGAPCHCGSCGCLETYIGRRFLLAAAELPETSTTADIVRALDAEDPVVLAAVSRAGSALGIALASALNLLDIRDVIIGTGLSPLLPWLSGPIRAQLDLRLLGRTSTNVDLLPMPIARLPSSFGGAVKCLQERLSASNIAR